MDISVPEVSPHGEPVGIDLGLEKFLSILEFVCHKRGVYFELVDPNLTSQICPRCQTVTGKKLLSERVHSCSECGYTTDRDVAVAQLIAQRGLKSVAVGRTVQRDNAVLGVSPMSDGRKTASEGERS